ncbi:hypothetical protein FIBSPDRAFT_276207 [Athelia psychrophila]|uniref:Uncharacterized protein n=1 Tax=Athelia psychrophila TaxID=1759441 RepID=A0A166REZ5_9AGAM|nr:hypothetical protein FIBSPDRAFT_276207 [Fibularhizoctonia sp. CBS 109695]
MHNGRSIDQGSFTRILHGRRQRPRRYQSPSLGSHLFPPIRNLTAHILSLAIRKTTGVVDVVFTPALDPWPPQHLEELPELDFGDAAVMQTLQSLFMTGTGYVVRSGEEGKDDMATAMSEGVRYVHYVAWSIGKCVLSTYSRQVALCYIYPSCLINIARYRRNNSPPFHGWDSER